MYTVKSNEDLQASLQQVLALLEKGRVLEDPAARAALSSSSSRS